VREKKLDGISDMRDETDRQGMRLVVEIKREANPRTVLNQGFDTFQLMPTHNDMRAMVRQMKFSVSQLKGQTISLIPMISIRKQSRDRKQSYTRKFQTIAVRKFITAPK